MAPSTATSVLCRRVNQLASIKDGNQLRILLSAQARIAPSRPLRVAVPGTALAVALCGHRRQPIAGRTALGPAPASCGSAEGAEMSVDSGGGCVAGSGLRAGRGVSWLAGGVPAGGAAAGELAAVPSL